MKEPIRDPDVLNRMSLAMDLYAAAEEMMRQNLRRRHPRASSAEIETRLLSWLRKEDEPEDLPPLLLRQPAGQHR